jgi:hypothetical protein
MTNSDKDNIYWQTFIDNIPYEPERDLFRILKYGTYNLLDLFDMDSDDCPFEEFSKEEIQIMGEFFDSV